MARATRNFFRNKWKDLMEALSVIASGVNPDDSDFITAVAPVDTNPLTIAATATGVSGDRGTTNATITVGDKTYTIKAEGMADPEADEVDRGTSASEFASNLAAKVIADTAQTLCTCVADGGNLLFTANTPGTAGNSIALSTTDNRLTLGAFAGGAGVYPHVQALAIPVTGFPENEEVVALASAKDTTGGRTSADLVNKYGSALAVLLNITEVNGTGTLSAVVVEIKIGNTWREFALWEELNLTGIGSADFVIAPAGDTLNHFQYKAGRMLRTYRVRVVTTSDAEDNDITYSVTVVHLL